MEEHTLPDVPGETPAALEVLEHDVEEIPNFADVPTLDRNWSRANFHFMAEEYGWVMRNDFLVAKFCCGENVARNLRGLTSRYYNGFLVFGLVVTMVGQGCDNYVSAENVDTCRLSFTVGGAFPICMLMWLTMNHRIVQKVAYFWTPYWMLFNYTVFQFLYMYMRRFTGINLFLSIVAWIIIMPCFGWIDAAPFEVRVQFCLICYGYLTVYYMYWFAAFFVFKDVFGDDNNFKLGGIEFSLSQMASSANLNLVIFMARYFWNIFRNRDSFVIWREQVKIFDEKYLAEFLMKNSSTQSLARSPMSPHRSKSSSRLVYMTTAESNAIKRESMRAHASWLEDERRSPSPEIPALKEGPILSPGLARQMKGPRNQRYIMDFEKRKQAQKTIREQLPLVDEEERPHIIEPRYNEPQYVSRSLVGSICLNEDTLERLRVNFIKYWKAFFLWATVWHVINFIMFIHTFGIREEISTVLQPLFVTIGLLPLSLCFWLTLNWDIISNLMQFLMVWWMMGNYTVGVIVWMCVKKSPHPAYYICEFLGYLCCLPFFGLTDACPEEIRAQFTRAVYAYLSIYYIFWTAMFTFYKTVDGDKVYHFEAVTLSLSSIILSSQFNLACFSMRYLIYILYDPHTFVIWTSRIVVKPLDLERIDSVAITPAIPQLDRSGSSNRSHLNPPQEKETTNTPCTASHPTELVLVENKLTRPDCNPALSNASSSFMDSVGLEQAWCAQNVDAASPIDLASNVEMV